MALTYQDIIKRLEDLPDETEIQLENLEESGKIFERVSQDERIPDEQRNSTNNPQYK